MKKFFTLLSVALLATGAFAATEQAWYNDVTSITNNGQYYIYSVNGKGFMQGGNSKVKAVTQNNYNSESNLLFTISTSNKRTYSGSNYLCSYETQTCGPVGGTNTSGSTVIWEGKSGYWLVYGSYTFIWAQKAYLRYESNAYSATCLNPDLSDSKFHWYLVSPAQYDRHWAIYLYDRYKENISDYTKYEGKVPSAYYEALAAAYAVTYNVQNADHSKEVVNAHRADLKALYDNAAAVEQAYANAVAAIEALEGVEDKGDGNTDKIDQDISNAYAAIEEAMSVDALNAAVSAPALKAIDPITFNTTTFTALQPLGEPASTVAGRTITYVSQDFSIINESGLPIYKGEAALEATAAETDEYYEFVRVAEVTVEPINNTGVDKLEGCEGDVLTYEGDEYTESAIQEYTFENITGGDSIVTLTVIFHQPTEGEEFMTITYGEAKEWHENDLSELTVGEHELYFYTTNVAGCDSTVTMTLTVNKQPAVTVPETLYFCQGDSVEFRNKWYKEAGMDAISALGEIRDTLFNLTIIENLPSASNEELTIIAGKDTTWHEYDLAEYAAGSYELIYTTTNMVGCDSTVTLALTVEKEEAFEVYYPISFCDGDSAEYRGKWYYESGEDTVLVEDEVRDTVIYVTVAVLPEYLTELNEDTLHVGDTLFIEADVWYLGEELVADTIIVPTEEGEFDLTRTLKNEFECDSVIVRHVVVEAKPDDQEIPTGWENVDADKKAVKVLRDGVIYIRREGKEYIVDGRLAK